MRFPGAVIITLLSFFSSFSQSNFSPGYVVRYDNDTVKGMIKIPETSYEGRSIIFKKNGVTESIKADEATAFGFYDRDRYFPVVTVDGARVFAELLFDGKADLYWNNNFFYISKGEVIERIDKVVTREATGPDGGRVIHSHRLYIGTLNRHFSDCLPARLLAGNLEYAESDFLKVFKDYSECSNTSYRQYKQQQHGVRERRLYWLGGVKSSELKFPKNELNIFSPVRSFSLGIGAEMPINVVSSKLFLTSELVYDAVKFKGARLGYTPTGSTYKDYVVKLKVFKLPIGLKYQFSHSGFSPALRGGLVKQFPLQSSWVISSTGATEVEYDIERRPATIAYWFAAQFQLNQIGAEIRFEKFVGFINFYGPEGETDISSSLSHIMFNVFYRF